MKIERSSLRSIIPQSGIKADEIIDMRELAPCVKNRIRRVSDYPSARGGLEDIHHGRNMINHLLLV